MRGTIVHARIIAAAGQNGNCVFSPRRICRLHGREVTDGLRQRRVQCGKRPERPVTNGIAGTLNVTERAT